MARQAAARPLLGLLQLCALAASADYTVSSGDGTLALTISAASGRVVRITTATTMATNVEASLSLDGCNAPTAPATRVVATGGGWP